MEETTEGVLKMYFPVDEMEQESVEHLHIRKKPLHDVFSTNEVFSKEEGTLGLFTA